MHFCCLQHIAFEGPAGIADWIERRGDTWNSVPLHAGAPLPELATVDAIVVLGGPMNIYQYRDHPWLRAEARFIEAGLAAGKKVIGVCLGAQILANLLGSRVFQNPEREIGWYPVQFTEEARALLPALPEFQTVLHWHGDTFDLPPDAVRLAASEACPEQGFLYRKQALALQFHLEMTPETVAEIAEGCRDELTPGRYVQSEEALRELSPLYAHGAQHLLARMLDEFIGDSRRV